MKYSASNCARHRGTSNFLNDDITGRPKKYLEVDGTFAPTRHPSKHPSQRSDGARQNRQGATKNPVDIDKSEHRRLMKTDRFPFTLIRSGVRVPQRTPQRPPLRLPPPEKIGSFKVFRTCIYAVNGAGWYMWGWRFRSKTWTSLRW